MRNMRAGYEKIVSEKEEFAGIPATVSLECPAFHDGEPIPGRFTADGDKISPPLIWRDLPEGTAAVVLVVEDPDAPSAEPFVHLIAINLPPDLGGVSEGTFKSPDHKGQDQMLGKNSYLRAAYLPPDPPTGHGSHSYVFQIFALSRPLALDGHPGRKAVVEAMQGIV